MRTNLYVRYLDLVREAREHIVDYFMELGKTYNVFEADPNRTIVVNPLFGEDAFLLSKVIWDNGRILVESNTGRQISIYNINDESTLRLADIMSYKRLD